MNKILSAAMSFAVLALFAGVALGTSGEAEQIQVREITGWTMETGGASLETALPCVLEGPKRPSSVTLTARVDPGDGGSLYLKTVYTPVEVYADQTLIFAYGQEGTYPAFLLDPPTMVKILPLPETGEPVTLTLRYEAPSQRERMTLYPILQGDADDLLVHLFSRMGFSLFFSIVLIALGMILWVIAFLVMRFEQVGVSVWWLGLFSFLTGIWIFGECNLTGVFLQNPPLLYLMAFLGMFTLAVPLIRCGIVILEPRHAVLLKGVCRILELAVLGAVLLQLFGIASFSRTMYIFHILIPVAFFIFAGSIIRETLHGNRRFAVRFLAPASVLAVFAFLEAVNYHLHIVPVQISFFFQLGVLAFVGMMCALCGSFMRYTFLTQSYNRRLAYELSLMEIQTEARKKQYAILSETAASIRAQRHDLKHHLTVIREYQEQHQDQKLREYLDRLSTDIPMDPEERLCENDAVNAVARYYLSMAGKEGITSVTLALSIPSDTGQVPDTDLCVVIGNLLENAVAACKGTDRPFIRMQSRLQYGILTITMDNSFQTVQKSADGSFRSQKSGGGSGLGSIRSVAKRYGGSARFETKGQVFSSSVYLYLDRRESGT